jgi:hypothetical protein
MKPNQIKLKLKSNRGSALCTFETQYRWGGFVYWIFLFFGFNYGTTNAVKNMGFPDNFTMPFPFDEVNW